MFTIKHVDGKGGTSLVQAKWFTSERRSDGLTQFLAFDETRADYTATWCASENTGPASDALYVMNESGSTVAVHRFNQPNFGRGQAGEAQADPALLAAREQMVG